MRFQWKHFLHPLDTFEKIFLSVSATKRAKRSVSHWESIRGKHKGEPVFIIGNGPSLRVEDLEMLHTKGALSIGSNRIFLAFNKTNWRPDYYTVADELEWEMIRDKLPGDLHCVYLSAFSEDINSSREVYHWKCLHNDREMSPRNFSSDLSRGLFGGHTVTYENIQIAVHLGCNPIYLLGCDHHYRGQGENGPGAVVKQGEEENHFVKGYRPRGERVHSATHDEMKKSFEVALMYSKANGIQILNATRGGKLEVFPRVDFDDVMNSWP